MSEYLVEDGTADRTAAVEPQLLRVFLATPSLRLTGPADGVFPLALRARVTALRTEPALTVPGMAPVDEMQQMGS